MDQEVEGSSPSSHPIKPVNTEVIYMFIRGWEWIIILVVLLLIIGPTQIPKLAKSAGSALGLYRSGVKSVKKELDFDIDDDSKKVKETEKA